jgi:multiple sugar transport system permease protein
MAFTVWPLIGSPAFVGFDNFVELFTSDPKFLKAGLNTAIFVFLFVPLNLVLSLALATWIGPKIKGRNFYRVLFFLPVVTPAVANATVWQLLLKPNGIVDGTWQTIFGVHAPNFLGSTSLALVSVVIMSLWMGIGYNILIFSAGLEAIPQSLIEAAAIDGAGPIRRYFTITLPMLSPSTFFATIMTIITSVQVFAQPYVLTNGGPEGSSSTLVMYLYQSGFVFYKLGYAASIAWVLFAVIMLVTALQFIGQKKWVHYE